MFSYDKKDYGINLIGYSRNGDFGGRIEQLKEGEKITVVYTKQVNYKKEFGQVTSETESADIKTFTYSPDMKIEVKNSTTASICTSVLSVIFTVRFQRQILHFLK